MVMHYIMACFILKEKVYDDLYMFLAMLIMIFIGIAFLNLYGDGIRPAVIRYGLALAISGVFAFINRRDIITLINYVKKRFLHKTS